MFDLRTLITGITLLVCLDASSAAPPAVTALAYRADGAMLAAGTHGSVAIIDPKTGEAIAKLDGQTGRVTAVAFSKDNRLAVASGTPGFSGIVRVYDAANTLSAKPVAEFTAHKDAIYAMAFSPDAKVLATAGYDRTIKLWDAAKTDAPIRILTDHSDAVYALAFHPDGKLLASGAADRAVKVWDVASGKRLYTLSDPTDWVYAVAWSPDGKTIVAGGVDKSLRTWTANAESGTLRQAVFAHTGPVTHVQYHPDGLTLYSLGDDAVVKAWDAQKIVERRTFAKQPDSVMSFRLRPDGAQIAIGRFDGTGLFLDPNDDRKILHFLPVKPKPPAMTRVAPDSVLRGKTTRLTIDGQRLDSSKSIIATATGVSFAIVSKLDNKLEVDLTVPANAVAGPISFQVASDAGMSPAQSLIVDRYPVTLESGITDSAKSAMKVMLPTTIIGSIDRAGDVDFYQFEVKAGQSVAVQALGTKLDSQLVIVDDTGKVLCEGFAGSLGFTATKAGVCSVGIRDREFRGGAEFTYRLNLGEIPVVTSVFPLGVARGKETDVHLDGVFLGSPHGRTVRVKVPADAVTGSKIAIPVGGMTETPLGDLTVVVGEFPSVVVSPDSGAEIRMIPGTADGILAKPGDAQIVRFTAKKGDVRIVETHARRLGSPIDTSIEILDATGTPVMRATLRSVAKTCVTFRDHDSANPSIRLEAWNELAANNFVYVGSELMQIRALPKGPDDDVQFVQVAGQRIGFLDTTPAHHALNTSVYKVEIHPPGTVFPPNGLPVFPVAYRNDDGGNGFRQDSRIFFEAPADGTYQVRVSDSRGFGGANYSYRLTVRPPRPDYTLTINPVSPGVWKNGAIPLTVTATRIDGFDGAIRVKLIGLPKGFEAIETEIEAGQTSATFGLFAAADAVNATVACQVESSAMIAGKSIVRTIDFGMPKVIEPGDVATTTDVSEVTIIPGGQTRLRIKIERRNGLDGRVPADVRGLPHGVRVLNIGLNGILFTPRDTEREVVIFAEPWVKPMQIPFVALAKSERKGTEHAAKPVMLKVVAK